MRKLKYLGYSIVCEEIPDEISLAINISGCPHRCEGCHSKYLWEYRGGFISEDIQMIIDKYKNLISCVVFMGGDQNLEELIELCRLIKEQYGLKVGIYSGVDNIRLFDKIISENIVDYLKIGSYKKEFGGLNNPGTNQKIFMISDSMLIDITNKMMKRI